MHNKIFRWLSCVSLSLFLSFGCCFFNPIADLSTVRPLIVHADGGAVAVKRKILEYITMLLASGKIALSNIAQNAPDYWENLKGLVSTYATVNNITDEQWEEINNNIKLGNDKIVAVGGEAANKLNGFVNWLKDAYDLSSLLQFDSLPIVNLKTGTYSLNLGKTLVAPKKDKTDSNLEDLYISAPGCRLVAIISQGYSSGYIYVVSQKPQNIGIIRKYSDNNIKNYNFELREHEYGGIKYYYEYFSINELYSLNIPLLTVSQNVDNAIDYCFGTNAVQSIDAVTPDGLPEDISDIDANKSYELSLKNMHDIDLWKDADLSSEEGIEQAINKGIENPVSIDVGNGVSIPVAYPIDVTNADGLKVPISVGKEASIDQPIPTAVPTTVPTAVPTAVPTVNPFPDGTTASDYGVLGLQDVFPFCIPFDIYNILFAFCATPETPVFTWNSPYGDVTFDFHKFDDIAFWWRKALVILFLIWLLQSSRSSSLGD